MSLIDACMVEKPEYSACDILTVSYPLEKGMSLAINMILMPKSMCLAS